MAATTRQGARGQKRRAPASPRVTSKRTRRTYVRTINVANNGLKDRWGEYYEDPPRFMYLYDAVRNNGSLKNTGCRDVLHMGDKDKEPPIKDCFPLVMELLPPSSIAQSRRVCRMWRDTINNFGSAINQGMFSDRWGGYGVGRRIATGQLFAAPESPGPISAINAEVLEQDLPYLWEGPIVIFRRDPWARQLKATDPRMAMFVQQPPTIDAVIILYIYELVHPTQFAPAAVNTPADPIVLFVHNPDGIKYRDLQNAVVQELTTRTTPGVNTWFINLKTSKINLRHLLSTDRNPIPWRTLPKTWWDPVKAATDDEEWSKYRAYHRRLNCWKRDVVALETDWETSNLDAAQSGGRMPNDRWFVKNQVLTHARRLKNVPPGIR